MDWFSFELSVFLWVFVALNIVNVVIQTIKSIATVKWGAWAAAATNAVAYALYTVVVVYMTIDGLGLFWKAVIIGIANLIGVYVVKAVEFKKRKDKLWKVEATVPLHESAELVKTLQQLGIANNILVADKYAIVNCYCPTQHESEIVKAILSKYNAKYFVAESKTL